jgi:sugar phosphate isomerase/epimerase
MTRPDVGRLIGMTVGFARLDAEAASSLLAELGFEAVEIHLLQLGPGMPGVPVFERHAEALGLALRDLGLVVSSLNGAGAPGFDPLGGGEALHEAAGELARQLRLAAALGSPRVLCWDGRLPDGAAPRAAPGLLAECVAAAIERSELDDPPAVSVELHPFTFALERLLVREVADALAGVGAGICLDFCHFGVALGADFGRELSAEVLRAVNHVHFADTDCATSELHFPPGEGVLDLDALVSSLEARDLALAWDLFGWPAPRAAIRRTMPVYAHHARRGSAR